MTFKAPARTTVRTLASSVPGAPAALRTAPPGRVLAAVALVALIGTGCSNAPAETGGGGGTNPASGSNATGGAENRGDQTGPTGTPGPVDPKALQERRDLAKCMRENGVEGFPDPDANGAIIYNGDDPDMTSAREKCHKGSGNERPGSGG